MKDAIERWIGEEGLLEGAEGAPDPLLALLVAARRAREAMPDDEAGAVLARVRPLADERRRRVWGTPGARWFAGLAATLALAGGMAHRTSDPAASSTLAAATPVIVKQVRFETSHDGKLVSLELTLYRVDMKKEQTHVPTPSL
jgi:hypothetical protein